MNYWHAETTNLAECHEPLMDLVADLSRAGASTAKDFYGCRGWAAHHNVDLWRSTWPTGDQEAHPYWVNWQMGGPWLCQHLWEHYAFSVDRSFLERAYPAMRGAALFLLDYLVQGPDGKLVTCPSTSPENSFLTPDGDRSRRQRGVHDGHLADQGPFPPLHHRLGDPRLGRGAESGTDGTRWRCSTNLGWPPTAACRSGGRTSLNRSPGTVTCHTCFAFTPVTK